MIPHQLYEYELKKILDNASEYLPFLKQNEDGISNKDKILSVFKFKIPDYVGPLNTNSDFAWIQRKAGKILPWNFQSMIDDGEPIEVNCHFCNTHYHYSVDDLKRMLEEATH